MNLISCDECGIVLDQNKLQFPHEIYDEDGYLDITKARYNPRTGTSDPYILCPLCESVIFKVNHEY